MPFITLMTDFGIQDGAMCAMKGAIWGNCPKMQSYHIISNSVTGLGVKTDDVMEAHFSHA